MSRSDSVNNVEIFKEENFPAGDELEIRVHAYSLMNGPQPFALAITGMDEGPIPEPATFFGFILFAAYFLRRK